MREFYLNYFLHTCGPCMVFGEASAYMPLGFSNIFVKSLGALQILESAARKSPCDQNGFSCRFCYFCNMGTQAACQTMQKHIFWGTWLVMQFLLVKTHCCMLSMKQLYGKRLHEVELTLFIAYIKPPSIIYLNAEK